MEAQPFRDGRVLLRLLLRLEKPVDCDYRITARLLYPEQDRTVSYFLSFGHGRKPAHFAEPGDIYFFAVPVDEPPEEIDLQLHPLRPVEPKRLRRDR